MAMPLLEDAVEDPETTGSETTPPTKSPSEIRLRPMEPRDADAVFDLCRQFHESTPYSVFQFSRKRFEQHLEAYLGRKERQAAIIALLHDEVVGIIWVKCGTYMMADQGLIASTQVLCVDTKKLSPLRRARVFAKLYQAAAAVSRQWGALQLVINATPGAEARSADRLIKRLGAELVGGNYVLKTEVSSE